MFLFNRRLEINAVFWCVPCVEKDNTVKSNDIKSVPARCSGPRGFLSVIWELGRCASPRWVRSEWWILRYWDSRLNAVLGLGQWLVDLPTLQKDLLTMIPPLGPQDPGSNPSFLYLRYLSNVFAKWSFLSSLFLPPLERSAEVVFTLLSLFHFREMVIFFSFLVFERNGYIFFSDCGFREKLGFSL